MSKTGRLDVAEVDRVMAEYPRTRVGTEQEYKWLVDPVVVTGAATPGLAETCLLPVPAGMTTETPFSHTQSSVYFDCDWQLTSHQVTLKALVNYGLYSNVSWICAKQTVAWIDGCRDSLEVSERIDAKDLGDIIRQRSTIALQYLDRLLPGATALAPFATCTQVRHKVPVRTSDGALMQLSLDLCTTKAFDPATTSADTWIEIETSHSDLQSRRALNEWAEMLNDRLGIEPHSVSKPEHAASQAGWAGDRDGRVAKE